MTVLADFTTIIHDLPQGLDVPVQAGKQSPVGTKFNAGGRLGEGSGQTGELAAFIMFSVLNLQIPLHVFVNSDINDPVGTMDPNSAPGWNSQVITISGGRLNSDGINNQISVAIPPTVPVGTTTFKIKNLI